MPDTDGTTAFEGVPEQAEVCSRLRVMLARERLPHAFLFVGSLGTGRRQVAADLGRVLLCNQPPAPDAWCGACPSCRLWSDGAHPDYVEEGVPERLQSLPIRTVREMQRHAAIKPVAAGGRFFVVRDAERMTIDAANCFLKTLEEPPAGCVFVLIASSLRTIPETIVSRCQVVRFGNLRPDVLQERLEADGLDAADARWLARRAWGSPGLADKLREAGLTSFNAELVERLKGLSLADNFAMSDWLDGKAREMGGSARAARAALQELLECVALHYRDLAAEAGPAEADTYLAMADAAVDAIESIGANAQRRLALDHLFTVLGMAQEGAA